MKVERYDFIGAGYPTPAGNWVHVDDHQDEVERLRAENLALRDENQPLHDAVQFLKAQVERLTARAEELQHALRLAIAGKPVRNADELLAADKEAT